MNKPIAVLISDVHFSVPTLELASQSLLKAQYKAKVLDVPLVIAGDLLDSKAIIRAECANKLIQMFSVVDKTETIILVGNHDLCNEKGKDHSLNFLKPYCTIVENPTFGHIKNTSVGMIPYQSDTEVVKSILKDEDCPELLIMHQGVSTSNSGHYIQDKSALPKECFENFRVISGHYHTRQNIKCGRPRKGAVGLFSYIGNPYTLNFGEANDPPKGIQILMDDGSLEFVPTNLRKHVVLNIQKANYNYWQITGKVPLDDVHTGDLVWAKVLGTREELSVVNKTFISKLIGKENFKLDLIPLDADTIVNTTKSLNQPELLDSLIDSLTNTSNEVKVRLKQAWKDLL